MGRRKKTDDGTVYADDVNYWKTSTSSPGTWLERSATEVEGVGGRVLGHAFGTDTASGRPAYLLMFELQGEQFRVVWPVLSPRKPSDEQAARRQAATALYYDVKARCVTAKFLGGRIAFFAYLRLPDGRTAGQLAVPELARAISKLLTGGES